MNDGVLSNLKNTSLTFLKSQLLMLIRTYNAVLWRVGFHHLEFYSTHTTANKEKITLSDRSVCFKEVRLEIGFEQIAGDTFHGIINRKNMDTLAILDVRARVDADNISQSDTKVVTNNYMQKVNDRIP